MRKKGILLYSGGLDSLIAARLLLDQGIELTGLYCVLPFVPPHTNPATLEAAKMAEQINLPLEFHRLGREYLDIIKDPPHGHGKEMNPCVDCKIYFMKIAGRLMREEDAAFVATGEVVGQRPMSQMKNTMRHIEKESGLQDYLLRPLSAKILSPTRAEREGIVDRERLLDIHGRGRKRQMALAEEYGIQQYQSPAGGCFFTDPYIAGRVGDLVDHQPGFTAVDTYLLTVGRHLRPSPSAKIIVARNSDENDILEEYRDGAACVIIPGFRGPLALVTGDPRPEDILLAAQVIARYGKFEQKPGILEVHDTSGKVRRIEIAEPADDVIINTMRI